MPVRRLTRLSRFVLAAGLGAALLLAAGCSSLGYYAQAAHGQFSLLAEARPIDDWLADPNTSERLRGKLQTVREIRRFAVEQLALPDNGSYKTYAQLQRPFVVWNVVAAPALSLTARQWCFPVAGCVDYRGYYSQQDAQQYADGLVKDGDDVQVLGVPAYSTLGWFNDPVMSTFINYPDGELSEAYGVFAARKEDFLELLLKYRSQLEANYQSDVGDADKLQRKAAIFDALRAEYQQLKAGWGGFAGYDRWFAMPLSNAHLALVGTYYDRVPAFRVLFRQSRDFADFFEHVKALAKLDKPQRDAELDRLQAQYVVAK